MHRVLIAMMASVFALAACGGTPPMPKGPPPEYEEHDAGTPIFEGESAPPATVPVK